MKKLCIISLFAIIIIHLLSTMFSPITAELENDMETNNLDYVPGEIIVKFKDKIDTKTINEFNVLFDTSTISKNNHMEFHILKLPNEKTVSEMVEKFNDNINVEYAEPNYILHSCMFPNDPYYNYQWHLHGINEGGIDCEPAWDISTGSGAIVAVLDSGITQATDLANTCFVAGYDFVNNDNDPSDDRGHGTHVAGTIAQSTNNNLGVCGVAFNSCLMPVKVMDINGNGNVVNIALGIYYSVYNGANIISMSLGGPNPSQTLENAVAYAYNNGVTVIAASGNDDSYVSYPAAYDDYVIAVGATRFDKTRAWYSNYGSSLDLVAPGGDISLDQNNDGYVDGVLQQTFDPNWGYYFWQGTSMACPHVSGVAALIYSMGLNDPDDIRYVLQSTSIDLGSTGWDQYYGSGLVNAYNALQFVLTNYPPVANFSWSTNDLEVNFSDESIINIGYINSWSWDFGDGNTSTLQNPLHQYSSYGTYTVSLNITDNYGNFDFISKNITLVNSKEFRSIYGLVYIDDGLPPPFVEVKLTFPSNVYTDFANSYGAYTITVNEYNYEEGFFEVYYNGLWYIPTDNQSIILGGSGEIGYYVDLHINTSITPPDTENPSKVTGLAVTDKKDGKLDLSWNAATDNVVVDYYSIFRDNIFIFNTRVTTYSDSGLTNGQQYKYEVQAVDTSNNTGPISDPAYGTPTASSSGGGGIIYVDDDADPGWYDETHLKMIQEGINNSTAGGTVFVYNGTYEEHIVIKKDNISLIGEDKNSTIIKCYWDWEFVIWIYNDGVKVSGFTITNETGNLHHGGIWIEGNYAIISDNIITFNSGYGILIRGITENWDPIITHNNTIVNNIISYNHNAGLVLVDSINNKIINNTFIDDGISFAFSYNNTFENNIINDKPLIYLENKSNITIKNSGDVGQVILLNCNNITVQNQELINADTGLILYSCNNCSILKNNISDGNYGIEAYFSSYNRFEENSIRNNSMVGVLAGDCDNSIFLCNNISFNYNEGFRLSDSDNNIIEKNNFSKNGAGIDLISGNNTIFHNNFINNTNQASDYSVSSVWDNGYPSGGNYWSNYNGTDSDGDGIGDTPYNVTGPAGAQDLYPLMKPWDQEFHYDIYVDDDADPSWYDATHLKTIQEGIDAVTENGTVYVYNGTYYENVDINKSINLIGENKETSMIIGVKAYGTIRINSNNVNISDLTVITSFGNIGIRAAQLSSIKNTSIRRCNFYDIGEAGIELSNCIDSIIRDCIFNNNISSGIQLDGAPNTRIINCSINNTIIGIYIHESDNVSINKNLITNTNVEGIRIQKSNNCRIYHNNFINNFVNGNDNGNNMWDNGYPTGGNYWDNYQGTDIFSGPYQNLTGVDGIGDKPYNISGGYNQDNYPFIEVCGWINHPPYIPSNPVPADGATSVSITQIISWSGGDSDIGDALTYDVYFGTTDPPLLLFINQSENTRDPGTLSYQTKYYWKIIAWDNENECTEGSTWSFTTISKPSSGGSGGGGGFIPIGPTNQPPIARINVSDDSVFVDEVITFDGNGSYDQDSDKIANWTWDFKDGSKGYGSVIEHLYSKEGIYAVTLTVKDEKGATGSESVDIAVVKPNIPPLKPTINGSTSGNRGISYYYTITSTDEDNDTIQYIINWGDNSSANTLFLPNGTATIQNHTWISAGKYTINVKAYDNETISETSSYVVLIDVILIDEFSYLIDEDSDGNYDKYYNETTDSEGNVRKNEGESYWIDIDGNGEWDFTYLSEKGLETFNGKDSKETSGMEFFIFIIVVITFSFILTKKKNKL